MTLPRAAHRDRGLRWARDAPTPDVAVGVNEAALALVPRPLDVTFGPSGASGCLLANGLAISYPPEFVRKATWFQGVLAAGTGWDISLVAQSSGDDASIALNLGDVNELSNGGARGVVLDAAYRLSSTEAGLVITAPEAEGAFYALQTLRQLLPDSTFGNRGASEPIRLPALVIADAPRFT